MIPSQRQRRASSSTTEPVPSADPQSSAAIDALPMSATRTGGKGKQVAGDALRPGTLQLLSVSMPDLAQKLAAKGQFLTVHHNINIVSKPAEEILART